jgi:hypothetical protein
LKVLVKTSAIFIFHAIFGSNLVCPCVVSNEEPYPSTVSLPLAAVRRTKLIEHLSITTISPPLIQRPPASNLSVKTPHERTRSHFVLSASPRPIPAKSERRQMRARQLKAVPLESLHLFWHPHSASCWLDGRARLLIIKFQSLNNCRPAAKNACFRQRRFT